MKKRTWISILLTLSVTLGILLVMGLTASAAEYDLWLKGVQVTDDNKDDVLGDGVFQYNNEEKKLCVNGECTSGTAHNAYEIESPGLTIIKSDIDGLTIEVLGDRKSVV